MSSFVKFYAHIVFSTKYRFPFLKDKELRNEIHSYMGGILNGLDAMPVIVGGIADHVHILCSISKNEPISRTVGELKRVSSIWIKARDRSLSDFYWQNGYGAFSVAWFGNDVVRAYIENQEVHHAEKTFQNEYRKMLVDHEIEYDERYVWD
jgi:REP element-mobilizing transposase RayT